MIKISLDIDSFLHISIITTEMILYAVGPYPYRHLDAAIVPSIPNQPTYSVRIRYSYPHSRFRFLEGGVGCVFLVRWMDEIEGR